jgi:hypothetical protein
MSTIRDISAVDLSIEVDYKVFELPKTLPDYKIEEFILIQKEKGYVLVDHINKPGMFIRLNFERPLIKDHEGENNKDE